MQAPNDSDKLLFQICRNVSEKFFKEEAHRAVFVLFACKIWFLHTYQKDLLSKKLKKQKKNKENKLKFKGKRL
jgi:hypothetical protein